MSFTKAVLLFLSFVASVHALATPHVHRAIHHRAIAARVPAPAPVDLPVVPVRRRSNAKRCKPRSAPVTSSAAQETTKTPAYVATPTTTHEAPAPTTTHEAPAPTTHKPSPTHESSPTTTKQAPAPQNTASGGNYLTGIQVGEGTFYSTGLGACGITNNDNDLIAAVSHDLFDTYPGYNHINPNTNPLCGRKVTAKYKGKSVTVAITDRCTGCQLRDLDFSPSAFSKLADFGVGRLFGVEWTWD